MVGGRACSGTWHWRRGGGVGGPTPRRSPSGEGLGPPSPRPSAIGRHPVAGKPPRPAPPPPPQGVLRAPPVVVDSSTSEPDPAPLQTPPPPWTVWLMRLHTTSEAPPPPPPPPQSEGGSSGWTALLHRGRLPEALSNTELRVCQQKLYSWCPPRFAGCMCGRVQTGDPAPPPPPPDRQSAGNLSAWGSAWSNREGGEGRGWGTGSGGCFFQFWFCIEWPPRRWPPSSKSYAGNYGADQFTHLPIVS